MYCERRNRVYTSRLNLSEQYRNWNRYIIQGAALKIREFAAALHLQDGTMPYQVMFVRIGIELKLEPIQC